MIAIHSEIDKPLPQNCRSPTRPRVCLALCSVSDKHIDTVGLPKKWTHARIVKLEDLLFSLGYLCMSKNLPPLRKSLYRDESGEELDEGCRRVKVACRVAGIHVRAISIYCC